MLCVLEVPQASLGCSQGSFISHASCAGREQAWLAASPSLWQNWDTTGTSLPAWQQEDKSRQQQQQQQGAMAKCGHRLHLGVGQPGGRAEAPWREARARQHRECGGLDQALPAGREQCREQEWLQGRRGLEAAGGLIHGTHTAPPAASRGPQLGVGPYPASCSGDGGITVARWPGWQSSQRGYSPSGSQEAPGIAPQGSRIQPLDPGAGAMALLMHAPLRCIVPSMLG